MFERAEKYFFQIVHKGEALIKEYYQDDWLKIVIIQINNKEAFREFLIDFNCWFDTTCNIFQYYYID